MYPVGFPADLDGDVAAFGDEAVVDGRLLEHGGAFPFSGGSGLAQHTGPDVPRLEAGGSGQEGGSRLHVGGSNGSSYAVAVRSPASR